MRQNNGVKGAFRSAERCILGMRYALGDKKRDRGAVMHYDFAKLFPPRGVAFGGWPPSLCVKISTMIGTVN